MRIFCDINLDQENDPDFKALLATLGHMPFAITLMPANLGEQGQPTARALLNVWLKFEPDILPSPVEQRMKQSASRSVPSKIQMPDFIITSRNDE